MATAPSMARAVRSRSYRPPAANRHRSPSPLNRRKATAAAAVRLPRPRSKPALHRGKLMQMPDPADLPNIDPDAFERPTTAALLPQPSTHPPRILLLYGSLRERSFSRFLTQEAARLLEAFGAETRIFNPSGLPLPDDAPSDHPRV